MRIYIVRHGETNMNKQRIFQGQYNEPLNKDGVELARLSGEALKGITFDEAYSSPLDRSVETVKTILNASNNLSTPIFTDERIMEINVGEWTLKNIADTTDPEHFRIKQFFVNPFDVLDIPQGENVYDVMKRTQEFIVELASRNDDKTYLVGTHGFAMRSLLNMFYKDKQNFWHGHVPYNCCFNILEVTNGETRLVEEDVCYYQNSKTDYYK